MNETGNNPSSFQHGLLNQIGALRGYLRRGLAYARHQGIFAAIRHSRNTAAVRRTLRLRDSAQFEEYRKAVNSLEFDVFDTSRPIHLHDLNAQEREAYVDICDIVAQTPESITQLRRCMEYLLDNQIPGDFVECGVYKGAGPYVIAKVLQENGAQDRRIWLYDTFEGMPEPDPEVDIHVNPRRPGDHAHAEWLRTRIEADGQASEFMRSPLDTTRAFVLRSGYPDEYLEFVKGMVEETIPDRIPERIALLRLDTDFYSSTRHELNHLYPRLVPGGILIIDDYGAFAGARKAVDEYFAEIGEAMCLFRIDEHVRAGIKMKKI